MKITTIQQPKPFIPKVPDFKVGDVLELNVRAGRKLTYLVTKLGDGYYLVNVHGSGKWTDPKDTLKELQGYLDKSANIQSVKVYSTEKVELILKEEY